MNRAYPSTLISVFLTGFRYFSIKYKQIKQKISKIQTICIIVVRISQTSNNMNKSQYISNISIIPSYRPTLEILLEV